MHPKYQEAIKLRKKGKSYGEIVRAINISKNSVSRWCKNLTLPLFAQKILEKKNNQNKKILIKYNQLKSKKAQAEHRKIKGNAAKRIHSLSKYELLLVGTALYWGEGWKKETQRAHSITFVNSDPEMIKLFLRFAQEILQIPKDQLHISIRVHPNINKKEVINFWSRVTNISKKHLRLTRQISKLSQGKRPKNSLLYGTLSVNIHNYQKFFQIKGWINGLIKQSSLR
jgi:hypothetical protein